LAFRTVELSELESCRLDDLVEQLRDAFESEFPRCRVLGFRAEVQLLHPQLSLIKIASDHRDATGDRTPGHSGESEQSGLRSVAAYLGDAGASGDVA
jgi:hypothetical protein